MSTETLERLAKLFWLICVVTILINAAYTGYKGNYEAAVAWIVADALLLRERLTYRTFDNLLRVSWRNADAIAEFATRIRANTKLPPPPKAEATAEQGVA